MGEGCGSNKKQAESAAAENALNNKTYIRSLYDPRFASELKEIEPSKVIEQDAYKYSANPKAHLNELLQRLPSRPSVHYDHYR
jgi:hypothetical protein